MNWQRPKYSPYVEISIDSLLHNLAQIRAALPSGVGVIAVVKDCSYGCGGVEVAKALEVDGGVDFFAVARPREAFVLRKSGLTRPVLVLGFADESELRFGADNGIAFALNDLSDIDRWKSYGVDIDSHVNIDTGMGRVGLLPSEVDELAGALGSSPNIRLTGAFTHMACADEPGTPTVGRQLDKFSAGLDKLRKSGINPAHIHYGNTAALLRFPLNGCTLARPGIALYGCKPDPSQDFGVGLKPVVSLAARVVKLKKVPAGTPVSYGGNYVTPEDTYIATIPIGYAHGLPRFLGGRGEALIGGRRYRVAGNVTMDYIMVDVGPNPIVSAGDEAVAMGVQGSEAITADDIAVIGGTIGYEVLCNVGTSVDRFYTRGGKIIRHDPGVIF